MLERDDHRAGVQPEHAGEAGARDPPRLTRGDGLLLEIGEQVAGAIDFDDGDQLVAQAGDSLDQVVPARHAVEGSGIHAPVLVHVEIGIGGHEHGVVLRGLDVPLAGIQVLPLDQWLEEYVGQARRSPTGRRRRRRN